MIFMLMRKNFGENLFDDFFDFSGFDKLENRLEKNLYGHHAANLMRCDVKEEKDGYELTIDLPGFTKDEISAEVQNGYLTISAAKGLDKDETEKESGRYIRRERYAGACQRSFYIGEEIPKDEIKAKFEHGILTLQIPKVPALPPENQHLILIE